jgi:hypothetical protein
MGDRRPDNGGGVPPEEGGGSYRGDLPDLPPEWGPIVIPDNASELDAEASALRRELRREAVRGRLWRIFGLPGAKGQQPSLGVPVVIMAAAVITTLLSLFVVTWDHRRSATAPVGPDAMAQATDVPISDVTLADASGARVKLTGVLPAVLLLVDGCECADLIASIAELAPPPVTIVPIAHEAPCAVGTAKNVHCLADPNGTILQRYPTVEATASPQSTPAGTPAAGASPSGPTPTARPVAYAVPIDATGTAQAPIMVDSATDLTATLRALAAGS